jgi:hypothetical protein
VVLNAVVVSDETGLMPSYSSRLLFSKDLSDFLDASIESIEKNPFDFDFSLELLDSSTGFGLEPLLSSDRDDIVAVVDVVESFIL